MFLRELYMQSYFYHAGDIRAHETPSEVMEERLSDAADTVLTVQVEAEAADELLAPGGNEDDSIARERLRERREA
jgi:hypothetical protein